MRSKYFSGDSSLKTSTSFGEQDHYSAHKALFESISNWLISFSNVALYEKRDTLNSANHYELRYTFDIGLTNLLFFIDVTENGSAVNMRHGLCKKESSQTMDYLCYNNTYGNSSNTISQDNNGTKYYCIRKTTNCRFILDMIDQTKLKFLTNFNYSEASCNVFRLLCGIDVNKDKFTANVVLNSPNTTFYGDDESYTQYVLSNFSYSPSGTAGTANLAYKTNIPIVKSSGYALRSICKDFFYLGGLGIVNAVGAIVVIDNVRYVQIANNVFTRDPDVDNM